MTSAQDDFFTAIGATFGNDGHSHFSNSDGEVIPDNSITVLPYYGVLAITGPEAAKFLQGQTSCNVDTVDDQLSCPGAYCTPKGRMLSSFHLARQDEQHYLLRMRRDIVDSTLATLSKYIVFSKAVQSNRSNDFQLLGLYGDRASTAIATVFGEAPMKKWQTVHSANNLAIQLDDDGKIFECWVNNEQAQQYWQQLSKNLTETDSRWWSLLTSQQGWGEVSAATVELFIPQMLNYQLTGAVSFSKGCYTGQEVVARMEHRGKLKRRLYRAVLDSNSVQAGDEIHSNTTTQSVGNIVATTALDNKRSEVLAVISNQAAESAELFLSAEGPRLQLLSLPYEV